LMEALAQQISIAGAFGFDHYASCLNTIIEEHIPSGDRIE